MNQFSADIAAILEIAIIAAGFITLYFAKRESSKLLSIAAWIMIIGGIATAICTTTFWFKYYLQGDFNSVLLSMLF